MGRIEVEDFDLTDRAIDKASWHSISVEQIYAVLNRFRMAIRNRSERAASHILYGTDDQGRCLAIPINPTDDPLVWRPITAWYCKPREAAVLRKARGQ